MKVKLVCLLENGRPNVAYFHTQMAENESGANHIVEAFHRYLTSLKNRGPLPPQLLIKQGSCTWEIQN